MSTAETLREAAKGLRNLAETAPEGPWLLDLAGYAPPGWPEEMNYRRVVRGEPHPVSGWREHVVSTHGAMDGTPGARRMAAIAGYVAAMNPVVGLALADWLAELADEIEADPSDYCAGKGHVYSDMGGADIDECNSWFCANVDRGLAVARAVAVWRGSERGQG